MKAEEEIQNVIAEIMKLKEIPLDAPLKRDEPIRDVLDSMGILEVLVALEDLGYVTKYIAVDDIETVDDIVNELKQSSDISIEE